MKLPRRSFLETKYLFYSTLVIIAIVILSIWISGKGDHRSLFQNSILSISILAGGFFLFISFGLYYGLKLKDNVGSILNKEGFKKYQDNALAIDSLDFDSPIAGDGIGGAILSIVLWIVFSIVLIFLSYFVGLFFWSAILFLAAILYWVFFRALRFVFKNSGKCKGDLLKSFGFGFFYSFLYVSWVYGIIFLIKFIN